MLQIPVLPFQTKEKITKPVPAKPLLPDEEITLGKELARAAKQLAAPEQACLQLAAWARVHGEELAAGAVLRSRYEVLWQAAKQRQRTQAITQQQNALIQTEENIISVGAQASDAQTLAAYLVVQTNAVEKKLKHVGFSKKEIENRLLSLRRRVIEAACSERLSAGELVQVCELLGCFKGELPPEFVRNISAKITWQFACEQARWLWADAQRLFPREPARAAAWARTQNPEKNEPLGTRINDVLTAYEQAAVREQNLHFAKLLQTLAAAAVSQAAELLAEQEILAGDLLEKYARLCTRLDEPAEKADPALFIKLYFDGTERELSQAYERGQISAREFLQVRAQQLLRACGTRNFTAEICCRELKTWLEKKAFTPQQIARFQYEVITAADSRAVWEEIKKLISK